MRLSVTLRCPGGVGQPPARLRGTMENASTGQMRSSNPPPACGAGCARVRKSRFGVWPHGKAHSAQPVGFRMRFSVTTRPQSAPFREDGDTHSRHTRRLSTSQTHKAGHPSPHCHLALSVPVTLPLDPERSRPARSPSSGSVSCTATRPRAYLLHCHSALNVPLRYDRRRVAVYDSLPLGPERSAL